MLLETQKNNPDVRYAFVLDPDGEVLAYTFGSGFPAGLIDLNRVEPAVYQNTISVQIPESLVWDVAVPVFNGRAGIARVGVSSQSVQRVLLDLTSQVLLTTVVVLGVSLLAATFLPIINKFIL